MGRIRELINIFINPAQPERSLDELAADAGVSEADLKLLKVSMGGVTWKFADEDEGAKKGKVTKTINKEPQNQPEQQRVVRERNKGFERED